MIVASVAVSLGQVALGSQLLPRSALSLVVILTPLWSLLCWNLFGDVVGRSEGRTQLLLIAEKPEEFGSLSTDLATAAERPAKIVASETPADLAAAEPGYLAELVAARDISMIVLDVAAQANSRVVRDVAEVHRTGVRVRTLSLFYEEWLGKLPISELERVTLLFDIGELHRVRYVRARRFVDVACASLGALGLVGLIPVVLVGNLVANRGPLFFRQERVGKDGQTFEMLKLRTMKPSSPSGEWTQADDARITAFGNVLRQSHLDELPQILNVLRGELSIVGPRPEQTAYVEELRSKIPFYDARHSVRPGLTGWAQVKFGYASDEDDALEKLQYDMFYLRRQGIRIDLKVIGRTMRAVLLSRGR
jgi:lipopolysaccharide/colanic/teichoic acid biosynthesis glycosyltransferase